MDIMIEAAGAGGFRGWVRKNGDGMTRPARPRSRFVYIVDDDASVRSSLRALLATLPNTLAQGFASGDLFLQGLDERDDGVVLLDVNMPGTSGLEVLTALRVRARQFPAVMVTARGGARAAVESMRRGAVDFIEKPYDSGTLFDAIERAFAVIDQCDARYRRRVAARIRLESLTARERVIFAKFVAGETNRTIAEDLGINLRTVEGHRANLMIKLNAGSLADAMRFAFAAGLFDEEDQVITDAVTTW